MMETDGVLEISAHSTTGETACPSCQTRSCQVHSYYRRTPADLPISDRRVCLQLTVRRFYCRNVACPKATFAEPLPEVVPRHAQRTERLRIAQEAIGLAVGGQAGSRLSTKLRMPCSGDTLVRLVRRAFAPDGKAPQVVGVDDWAQRRRRIYGTILVDLEQHWAIDLLKDRTAETLATWLREHPSVKVVARDRSPEYARGISDGAPTAQQVADRWHLLTNLREVFERLIERHQRDLMSLPVAGSKTTVSPDEIPPIRSPDYTGQRLQVWQSRQTRQRALVQAVRQLHAQDVPISKIAHALNLSRTTVARYLAVNASPTDRVLRVYHPQPSILDPYLAHLRERWQAGCRNASELWRELKALGFGGSRSLVARWVRARRETVSNQTPKRYRPQFMAAAEVTLPPMVTPETQRIVLPTTRQLAWALTRRPETLSELEVAQVSQARQREPIDKAYSLAQRFSSMIRERRVEELSEWLTDTTNSKIKEFGNFAGGLQQDLEAVKAALQLPWSNGQTEGQINRLKLLKRQMYGRAKLDLLRARFLHPP